MSEAPATGPSSRSGALARVVRRLEAVPLRRRLVAIVGTLVGAALVITSLATAYTMRTNLLEGIDAELAQQLADEAHQVCPYSNAMRGNIEVTVTVSED